MIEAAFSELVPVVGTKAACAAVGRPRATHYRRSRAHRLGPPRSSPPNALSDVERSAVFDAFHEPRFTDKAPAQVWATHLDGGSYLGSESTMYRLLFVMLDIFRVKLQAVARRRGGCGRRRVDRPGPLWASGSRLYRLDLLRVLGIG